MYIQQIKGLKKFFSNHNFEHSVYPKNWMRYSPVYTANLLVFQINVSIINLCFKH